MQAKKILLVEDDLDIRENMAMVLEYENYEVLHAENGVEAIKQLEEHKDNLPAIILLDLFMPVMNGREFLDAIDAGIDNSFKKIPVILITASEQSAREDLNSRTAAVMRKPLDLKVFLTLLSTVGSKDSAA
nr:response regulator [Bacteriovorax sp. HI3]